MGNFRRRRFLIAAGALASLPLVGEAQQLAKLPRVGYLGLTTPEEGAPLLAAFRSRLAALGYGEGQTIVVDVRFAQNKQQRLPALAGELVHESKVNVLTIVGCGRPFIEAARRASQTVPLVVAICGDIPGFIGEVASLAKPGGNTTGQAMFSPELAAKRLELLKALVPELSVVAILWNPASDGWDPYWQALHRAATALNISLQSVEVRDVAGFDVAFLTIANSGARGLITLLDDMLWIGRKRVIDFAARQRIPAAYDLEDFAIEGGLLAYGPDTIEMMRGAASQVDRILKGTRPGEIPVERATKFRLVLNLKTARALGLAISSSILLRADRVIE